MQRFGQICRLVWVGLLSSVYLFQSSFAENDYRSPRIVRVEFDNQNVFVKHQGSASEQFEIRANVPDVRAAEFLHQLNLSGCKPFIQAGDFAEVASPLYPQVSKLNGTDFDLHLDELIKVAIGERVEIKRYAIRPRSSSNPTGTDSDGSSTESKLSIERKAIVGKLLGFKADGASYSLQVLTGKDEIVKIDSKDIIDVVFKEHLEELRDLAALLKRQTKFDSKTVRLTTHGEEKDVKVSYNQTIDTTHEPVLEIFATLNDKRTTTEYIHVWATLWNDTFYDWKDVTVLLKRGEQSYEIPRVNLAFGQFGTFQVNVPISNLSAIHQWKVTPPADNTLTAAVVTNSLELKNDHDEVVPAGRWSIMDFKGKGLVKATPIAAIRKNKIANTIITNEKTMDVFYKNARQVLNPKEIQGTSLVCSQGYETTFRFDSVKSKKTIRVASSNDEFTELIINPDRNESTGLPEILLVPNLKDRSFHSAPTEGAISKILTIDSPDKSLPVDLLVEDASTINRLASTSLGNVPDESLDGIVNKKKVIDRIKEAIASLKSQQKDFYKRQTIGVSSSYRDVLRRDALNLSNRKGTEISMKQDELAKLEYEFSRYLDSLPK